MRVIESVASPVRPGDRVETLDVLRGVAICGILLMNIPGMGLVLHGDTPPLPAAWNADWIAWAVQSTLFEGTMRGLFSILFGAGMLMMLRKAEGPDAQVAPIDIWTRRCLALMALGVVQFAVFLWPGEILWTYGLTGLALLAFRTARPKSLMIAAAILLVGLSGWKIWEAQVQVNELHDANAAIVARDAGRTLGIAQQSAIAARERKAASQHPTNAGRASEIAERTHFPSVLRWSADDWSNYNLGTDAWPWIAETLGFMLIGMVMFRSGVLTGAASSSVYRRLLLWGYGGGIGLRLITLGLFARDGFAINLNQPDAIGMYWDGAIYEPARLLITLGHVGLIVTMLQSGLLGKAAPLKALGRMALTVYSLQSILTSILFYGLGYVGAFGFATLMAIAAIIWVATALFALWWLARYQMGPAEMLLRAIAYNSFKSRHAEADSGLAAAR